MSTGATAGDTRPTPPLNRAARAAARLCALAAGLLLTLLALMQVTSIVLRFVSGSPVPGDFELIQVGVAVVIFLLLPISSLSREHFRVTLVSDRLPRRVQRAIAVASSLVLLLLALLLCWRMTLGAIELHRVREYTMMLQFRIWWAFVPIVAALAVLVLVALAMVTEDLRGRSR